MDQLKAMKKIERIIELLKLGTWEWNKETRYAAIGSLTDCYAAIARERHDQ